MRRKTKLPSLILVASSVLAVLAFVLPGFSASHSAAPITLDLHEYGFPTGPEDTLNHVFYISNDRIALFFDQLVSDQSPHNHVLKVMVFDTEGNVTAQLVVHADPKAVDIIAGPAGVPFGREGELSFYDSNLQLLRSVALAQGTTGIKFDRHLNQLVVTTIDEKSGQRTAHFRNGNSLEESAALSYPIRSHGAFGKDELVYAVPGNCKGAAHVISPSGEWRGLEQLLACNPLAFIGEDSFAYALDGRLYVVDSKAHQRLSLRIPAPDTFQMPRFIGLSDDHTRMALSALRKEKMSSGWPYYDDVFVYDLASKRMIFEHALKKVANAAALSPGGHQLATIEQGVLTLLAVP